MKKTISTKNAPGAIGPYSQAVQTDSLIFVSGQLPMDPESGAFAGDDITSQTTQSLKNVQAVLKEAGLTMDNVIKATVFMKDLNDFKGMNAVYNTFFNEPYPARAAVEVARLPLDARVEIEVIASL
ncbi:MAG: RidA family protein [Clostridiales bacterium]|nr:RidA family protein [Clostridiales bacterium]